MQYARLSIPDIYPLTSHLASIYPRYQPRALSLEVFGCVYELDDIAPAHFPADEAYSNMVESFGSRVGLPRRGSSSTLYTYLRLETSV